MNTKKLQSKNHVSLESLLKRCAATTFVVLFALTLWIMHLVSLSPLVQVTILTAIFVPFYILISKLYHRITSPFYGLTNLVEAIKLEDYSLRISPQFNGGIIQSLSKEIDELATDLQHRKQEYDQHTLLIYHLIEQLDSPIAIFNQEQKLSHANKAFSRYINQPWLTMRLSKSEAFGFKFDGAWRFVDVQKVEQWQIKQSQFVQGEQVFHLVILTNIEKELRSKQQKSWQQIIRVLSHEIRNSLTPIRSLAQTMLSFSSQGDKSYQALNVIVDRSTALQEFVNRYGDMSKKLVLNKSLIEINKLADSVVGLFPQHKIITQIEQDSVSADPVLLKQVLINLVKNSVEAADESRAIEVVIKAFSTNQSVVIEISDNGKGIANPDNLFVPFYTTKKGGHGIGLGFCQNIIEQHDGSLALENKENGMGAVAIITLAKGEDESK